MAYTTSHDSWNALQNIFNAKSRSWKLQLQHELSTLKKGGLIAYQYLATISKKEDEVRDVVITVDDEELALFAFDSLDSSYNAFVTTVTTTSGDISFSEFKGVLKAHETRILRESSLPLPFANYTQISGQFTKKVQSPEASPIVCRMCNKKGHTALICYNRHNES